MKATNNLLESKSPLLELKNITKRFGSNQANKNVNLQIEKGSIHAIIGENGAGKSTCAKIIFGMYQPDEGEFFYKGHSVFFKSPVEAKLSGIGMVHQHFMLAEPIPAIDHIFLDENKTSNPFSMFFLPLRRKKKLKELQKLSENFNMPVNWNSPIENLSIGMQQRIEIIKLLYAKTELMILDEPTAVLIPQEVEIFFQQLKSLKQSGKTIVIITHKLSEVQEIADKVTVFRRGEVVGTYKTAEYSSLQLSEMMVGRSLEPLEIHKEKSRSTQKTLSVENLNLIVDKMKKLQNISFSIKKKEIVGIAGVEGNGQSELLNCLIRPQMYKKQISGVLNFNENTILNLSSDQIRRMGIAFVPEDRTTQGLAMDFTMEENFILGHHKSKNFQFRGFFNFKNIRQTLNNAIEIFDIRPHDKKVKVKNLSGGNQQKLLLSRELITLPDLLIVAQPTRGVDIGASEKIHKQILNVKEHNGAVLMISSDLEELMKICDRLLVMFNGKIVGQFDFDQFNKRTLGALMGGVVSL